jgi:hypothetical protein
MSSQLAGWAKSNDDQWSMIIYSFLVSLSLSTLARTVRVCYYMPWLQSLDEWQSLPNSNKRNLTMLWVHKGIELVVGLICPLSSRLSRFASTARRAPLQIRAEVFLYCLPLKCSTLRQSKKLDNEFLVSKQRRAIQWRLHRVLVIQFNILFLILCIYA